MASAKGPQPQTMAHHALSYPSILHTATNRTGRDICIHWRGNTIQIQIQYYSTTHMCSCAHWYLPQHIIPRGRLSSPDLAVADTLSIHWVRESTILRFYDAEQ